MYKNPKNDIEPIPENWVSILVLMELCIKTQDQDIFLSFLNEFQSLF